MLDHRHHADWSVGGAGEQAGAADRLCLGVPPGLHRADRARRGDAHAPGVERQRVRGTSNQAFSAGNTLLLGSTTADGGAAGGTGSESGFFTSLTYVEGEPFMPNPPTGMAYLTSAPVPLPTLRAA